MTQDERRRYLIDALLVERANGEKFVAPEDADDQRTLLRALMNVRPPMPVASEQPAEQARIPHRGAHRAGRPTDAA